MSASAPQVISYATAPTTVTAPPQYVYATGGAQEVTYLRQPGEVTYLTQPAEVTYLTAPAGQQPYQEAVAYTYAADHATAAQPVVTYAAPQAATYSVPAPTYSVQATQPATYSVQAPTYSVQAPVTYAAPLTYSAGGLPPATSMVAYPGLHAAQSYFPTSVQAAWDNHFSAFGDQNLDKIMLDYDETSVARLYDNTSGLKEEFRGLAQIREMFAGLFAELSDLVTLKAPVVDVEEEPKQVFLVWECPACGYKTATDTFIFGQDLKIKRQNIVVTKGRRTASAAAAPAPPAASPSDKKASKKSSASKKTSKKKNKGCC